MSQTVKLPDEGIQHIPVADLTPYARNARKHPEAQIDQIAASIREFGFLSPCVISSDMTIIAGHGRVAAAKKLGLETVPCVIADHLTEAQRRAYVLIDNRLTDTSEWDKELLQIELGDLAVSDIDIAVMGFSPPEIEELELPTLDGNDKDASEMTDEELYTTKVESPIYKPTGPKPPISELFDLTKTRTLLGEIEAANIPDEEKAFLRYAANRHTVFNYQQIAEYYAHAPKPVQELMENSALVIIDFNKAIENGFVRMTKDIAEAYKNVDQN